MCAVAEAGGHAVDRDLALDQVALELACGLDATDGVVSQPGGHAAAGHGHDILDRQRAPVDLKLYVGPWQHARHLATPLPRLNLTRPAEGTPEAPLTQPRGNI